MDRIGNRLVADGRLEPAQLEQALARQEAEGGYLGQHLIDGGYVARTDFYDALARQWAMTTRDLVRRPPDPATTAGHDLAETVELGWVPCEFTDRGAVVVATAVRPGLDLLEEVHERFPGHAVEFVACTQRDLDHVAVRAHHARMLALGPAAPPHPLRHRVATLCTAALVALAAYLVLAASPAVTVAVVLTAGLVFVAGVCAQTGLALRAGFVERLRLAEPRLAAEAVADHLLPVYSVLVPVAGGPDAVRQALGNLHRLDYPGSRLDAVLLVADDDTATLAGIRSAAPPEWVRVLTVPADRLADVALACDDGLALARGRYVVVYAADDVPDTDQLRRAVAAFEADLADNLEQRPDRAPLTALRVRHRVWGAPSSRPSRMSAVDDALRLDDLRPSDPAVARLRRDLTSTHVNMRVLRRLGGWTVLTADCPAAQAPRIELLDSTSTRATVPGPLRWTHRRARSLAVALRHGLGGLRDWLTEPDAADRPTPGRLGLALAMPALFLAYPVLVVGVGVLAVRVGDHHAETLAAALLAAGLGAAVLVGGLLTGLRHGPRAAGHAVVVPVHWLLHGAAAWWAVVLVAAGRVADED